jgi:hypothetical protein
MKKTEKTEIARTELADTVFQAPGCQTIRDQAVDGVSAGRL